MDQAPRRPNKALRAALVAAIQAHPEIPYAAITGSQAAGHRVDIFSDLDLLVVARDTEAVRDVHAWWPQPETILLCAFHLDHYCTLLLEEFAKVDLTVFSAEDPVSAWVVRDYTVIKGDPAFEQQLATAAALTQDTKAAHLNPDICLDNVLLLLTTAWQRVKRSEVLSAHAFLTMAADMVMVLEKQRMGHGAGADLLDPRRRVEHSHPEVAQVIQESLFGHPRPGINVLAHYIWTQHQGTLADGQRKVLAYLLEADSAP